MLTAFRATLERLIQLLLYPGIVMLILGTLEVSILCDIALALGLFFLGITAGLLIAKALSYAKDLREER